VSGHRPRVYHASLPDPGGSGIKVQLDAEESHHVSRVLRLRPGDSLDVFDGVDREWSAIIEGASPTGAELRLVEPVTTVVEPEVAVVLFQAVCRAQRMEWAIQKGTELGVSGIRPFPGERGEAGAPTPSRLVRWRRIVLEAAKQSGRRRLPALDPVDTLPQPPDGILALLLEPGPDPCPLSERLNQAAGAGVWLAVGPESGFSEDELRVFGDRGWLPCSLGPRTLRAETAGVVAATIVLNRLGDLGAAERRG
jgi:16S rRNA (uracil1498-N3)-methyltransferase